MQNSLTPFTKPMWKAFFWLYSATKPSFIDVIAYFNDRGIFYAYDKFYTNAIINHSLSRLIISLLNTKKLSNWSVFLVKHIVRIKRHVIREKDDELVCKKTELHERKKLYMTWTTTKLETYGLQAMRHVQATQDFNNPTGFSSLQQHFERLSFDQQVLIWHITTELCFH
ncbi:hypothetical protein IEQ34_017589 [Dendrobium chrysotoxum]|uniref:Uncharacterized protein n=1 Tax=Dendrobium chrysotoxum TaxID=161865 RepID=A0AAV7GAS4_DENCH|nr:hypothetical protein IEQ34_017589 [Dendrobium chrysotoxum]